MKNRKKLTGARAVGLLRYLPLILWVAFFVFAFGWIVLASFSTTKEIFSNGLLQSGVHVENYTGVWERNHVAHYFVNSLITTGIPCVLIILIAAPAAYVLSKKTFFGRKQTFNAFVVGMSIPQVMLHPDLLLVCQGESRRAPVHACDPVHDAEPAVYGVFPHGVFLHRPHGAG